MLHMEPLAVWGDNTHSKSKQRIVLENVKDHVVLHIPRTTFRRAASNFSDVRHADQGARYDEIALQLFLKMVHKTANLPSDIVPADAAYPYVKAWLEWVPSATLKDQAVAYRLHAVSLHPQVRFGTHLKAMLAETSGLHADSMERKQNSRKVDPLAGLHPYQKWMRVSGKEMYVRTICDRYAQSQEFTADLDNVLDPSKDIDNMENIANPSKVFTLRRALELTPETADPRFKNSEAYSADLNTDSIVRFTYPSYVRRLTPEQIHPKVFCAKYLPDHQAWMEAQRAIRQKQLDMGYDPNCQSEYDIRTSEDMMRERLEGMHDRSAFSTLAQQTKFRYNGEIAPLEGTDEFPAAYEAFQAWATHALETQCLDPDASVSDVVSKMLTWRQRLRAPIIVQHRLNDPTMSIFANRVMSLMEYYEQYFLVSTAHRMMFLIQHAKYDSFRRDFGLHSNVFQAGEGATSKSFLFTLMDRMSIPGTIQVLTYQTGKADAVDGNQNDVTTVCHEAPPGMFMTGNNKNADSTQEAMFKEKLTSQRVTAKVYCQDETTGKRSNRLTKSECVGVWMGATNDPPSEVGEALKTRFFWGNFEQVERDGRDIDDCMNGERMMTKQDKAKRKELEDEAKEEQFRVMLVEKAIWTKVIRDVNTTATNVVIPRFKKKIAGNSIVRPGPRDWERVKIFARCLAIVTAIETVCNMPGGKHYGKPFETYMLVDIEPLLRVTEEMVIFTISLFADQFRSPVEHKILNAIWSMSKDKPICVNPSSSEDDTANYVKLPKFRQLCKTINSRIPRTKGRTSINNIEEFLSKMTKHSVTSRDYKMARPNEYPELKQSGAPQKHQSCIITHEGTFIHVSHVLNHAGDDSDSVWSALLQETHANSDDKRLLTAFPYSEKWYHIFKIIERQPGGAAIKYDNVLWNTPESRWMTGTEESAAASRKQDGFSINQDIDTYVAHKWSSILGKFVPSPKESVQRVLQAAANGRYMTYPDTYVAGYQKWRNKKRARGREEEAAAKKARALE